jgi:hypothetical protein
VSDIAGARRFLYYAAFSYYAAFLITRRFLITLQCRGGSLLDGFGKLFG